MTHGPHPMSRSPTSNRPASDDHGLLIAAWDHLENLGTNKNQNFNSCHMNQGSDHKWPQWDVTTQVKVCETIRTFPQVWVGPNEDHDVKCSEWLSPLCASCLTAWMAAGSPACTLGSKHWAIVLRLLHSQIRQCCCYGQMFFSEERHFCVISTTRML